MDMRMNRESPSEEYEEVESPYAPKSGSKVRNRKTVFHRPFAAEPSVAPAVFETTSRRSLGHPDQTDFLETRKGRVEHARIDYLPEEDDEEGEEEEVEKRPAKVKTKKPAQKKNLLAKAGWLVIGALVLRLIFMDRGVWDYFAAEAEIKEKHNELKSIQQENRELKAEITKIHADSNYQRLLAKEHLGVIAADEFLILFAGESQEDEAPTDTSL